jgi:hypothetical protein
MRFALNNQKAVELIDHMASIAGSLELTRDNIHLFVSPLFVEAMIQLMDKNIKTLSCGSGKERGILPGITGDYRALSAENKEIVKDWMISDFEFRIGSPIDDNTTAVEFEAALVKQVKLLKQQ